MLDKKLTVDVHSHLSLYYLNNGFSSLELYLENEKQIANSFILGGYSPEEWPMQQQLIDSYPDYSFKKCFGLHPWWCLNRDEGSLQSDFDQLELAVEQSEFIGETGLDYFKTEWKDKRSLQIEVFKAHIDLAIKFKKPLVLHIVNAHSDALSVLKEYKRPFTGLIHRFVGNKAQAVAYINLGFNISFGPELQKSSKVQETFVELSKSDFKYQLLIESDEPHDFKPKPDFLKSQYMFIKDSLQQDTDLFKENNLRFWKKYT